MRDNELSMKVAAILSEDCRLNAVLKSPVSAMLIPFMKIRETFYLLVSLTFVNSDHVRIEAMSRCLNALQLLIRSGIADDLPGIEIVPYTETEGPMQGLRPLRRLFRLSALRASFGNALNLQEQDLLKDKPAEGITCGWHVQKPSA